MSCYLVMRRYAPFKMFSGFEGDNRNGPSTSASATARCIAMVKFDRGAVLGSSGGTSGTRYTWMGEGIANYFGTKFAATTTTVTDVLCTRDALSFTLSCAGANPMVPLAPTIDTFVDAQFRFSDTTMTVSGKVRGDDFPNGEVFLRDDAGNANLIFDFRTAGGGTAGPATRLWGDHADQVLGSMTSVYGYSGGKFKQSGLVCPQTKGI